MSGPALALTPRAFVGLLLLARMSGANHVTARVAFDRGIDVATAAAAGRGHALQDAPGRWLGVTFR